MNLSQGAFIFKYFSMLKHIRRDNSAHIMKPYDTYLADKTTIIEYYENCLKRHQDELKIVGWRSKKRQDLRFKVLSQIDDLSHSSVLDLGCGLGALGEFFQKQEIQVYYTGYELCGRMVNMAKKLRPYLRIKEVDILKDDVQERFDWILSSGVFNLRLNDNLAFLKKMLAKSFDLCELGVGVNMLSTYVDYQDAELYYARPEEVFAFAKTMTPRVALRYDYMPYEFTLYLYKTDFEPDAF
ncbi:MAG: hypothetical protein DRH24_17985 [Deltaproteobacteria bacterium]|nr:MAG: hypothetical protein DRH24_17985 [Deltaproteobacteria bacterium]